VEVIRLLLFMLCRSYDFFIIASPIDICYTILHNDSVDFWLPSNILCKTCTIKVLLQSWTKY